MLLAAIALVSGLLTVMLGATIGVQSSLREKTSRYFAGDVVILGYRDAGRSRIDDIGQVLSAVETLKNDGIPLAAVTLRSTYYRQNDIELLASGYSVRQRRVVGVEWDRERSSLEGFAFVDGSVPDDGDSEAILLSSATARELQVRVDDVVTLTIRSDRGRVSSAVFRVAGIFHEESLFGFTSYIQRAALNRLREASLDNINEVGIRLADANRNELRAAETLATALSEQGLPSFGLLQTREAYQNESSIARDRRSYGVVTLSAQLEEITDLVQAVGIVAGTVVVLFLAIVSVGVSNTWTMVVWDRTREIGTLRAIGVSRVGVAVLLLAEAVFLALHGAILGLAGGGIMAVVTRWVRFPSNGATELLLQQRRVDFVLPAWAIASIAALVLAASLIGAARGTLRAARVPAAEAMRART